MCEGKGCMYEVTGYRCDVCMKVEGTDKYEGRRCMCEGLGYTYEGRGQISDKLNKPNW